MFLGQMSKKIVKYCLNYDLFMLPSIVVLDTQI